MDEFTEAPAEEAVDTDVPQAAQAEEGTTGTQPSEAGVPEKDTGAVERDAKPAVARNNENWNNGHRRIQQRQSMKARIKELEERLAQYEGKEDDYSRFQRQQLEDRIGDMNAMNADAEAEDFANRAAEFFDSDTPQFMQDVYRYAPYVNSNEPDLLKYTQRQYGPILLHEWMKRMDQPQLREQWLGMTTYEKSKVLDSFYNQIVSTVRQYQGQGQAPGPRQAPKPSVPVPNGGRQTPGNEPTSDFGIELGKAFARHKG